MSVYELSNVLSAFADAGMLFLLFEAFLERRTNLWDGIFVIVFFLLSMAIYICNYFLMFDYLNILIMMVLSGIISLLYIGGFWKKLITVTVTLLISLIIEVIVVILISFFLHRSVEDMVQIADYRLFGVIASKISGLSICNIIRLQKQRRHREITREFWLAFFLLYFAFLTVTFLLFRLSYALNVTTYNAEVVFCSLCLFFCITFSLFLYERQGWQSTAIRTQQQYEQQLKFQLKHLDDLLAKQNELRKFKHDIVNQLEGLRGYLQVGDVVGALHHLEGLTDHLEVITPAFNTGNVALDATLSAKKTLAESQGIYFSARLNVEENLPIAPEDICTIFGNALDNAIEACLLLDDEQQKSIALSLVQIDAVLLCKIINTALQQPRNNLTTSKKDKVNHGFGIVNLTESLAKYGSVPAIEWQEGSFSLSFILPLKDES